MGISEVMREWGGWNQQVLLCEHEEGQVTEGVCVDPASGNALCNVKIYLLILVLLGHSSESTLHPLAQTPISLCWRVRRPRSVCRQILYLVVRYSVAVLLCGRVTPWPCLSVFCLGSRMLGRGFLF